MKGSEVTDAFHIALVVNNDQDIWLWRRPLVQALLRAGVRVLVIAPRGQFASPLAELGCEVIHWPLKRDTWAPLTELNALIALYRIYRTWRPALVHHFTIKPNLYGTIAARLAGVPIAVATVTGLGYLWTQTTLSVRLVRFSLGSIYRLVLRRADAVIFLNADDREILGDGCVSRIILGEGVDLETFHPSAVAPADRAALRRSLGWAEDAPIVLMVSRMLLHKGVLEFVEAARRIRRGNPKAGFVVIGPSDTANPSHISVAKLSAWDAEGAIRYLGQRDDVRELMALADIVVLPSYYREGIPRVLVEGAAMGKPLVATDMPGCLEVVQDGVNGFLVPTRNPAALAEAIEKLLASPDLRSHFGAASRKIAEERFSDREVVEEVLALYTLLLSARGLPVPAASIGRS